jgi:putative redox protein
MPPDTAAGPDLGETVLISETGLGGLQMVARSPSAAFLIDEPVEAGGLASGPNPYDLMSAALGACTAMTLRLYARRKGMPLTRVQVSVRHHRASLEARDVFERTISLEGPLNEADRGRLLVIAERCPVHRTLDRGSDVRTTLSAAVASPELTAGEPEHLRDMVEAGAA